VSNGFATGNRKSMLDAAAAATANGVQVHAVYERGGFAPKTPLLPFATGPVFLRTLAEQTGAYFGTTSVTPKHRGVSRFRRSQRLSTPSSIHTCSR
jgi:hypothetical protein